MHPPCHPASGYSLDHTENTSKLCRKIRMDTPLPQTQCMATWSQLPGVRRELSRACAETPTIRPRDWHTERVLRALSTADRWLTTGPTHSIQHGAAHAAVANRVSKRQSCLQQIPLFPRDSNGVHTAARPHPLDTSPLASRHPTVPCNHPCCIQQRREIWPVLQMLLGEARSSDLQLHAEASAGADDHRQATSCGTSHTKRSMGTP